MSELYDPEAATLWWNAEGKDLSIVELYEAVTDPVAVVRRAVESGTIKGEETVRPHPTGGWPQRVLVIPAPDTEDE